MKNRTRAIKYGSAASLAALAGNAMAAVPVAVDTAIGTMQADAVTIATTFLVAIIAVVAIKFLRKGL